MICQMKKFNIIKSSRKKSKGIDEKIEYLNKECQKTGLNEITMSTSGIYQGRKSNPNSGYAEITGKSFNGKGFAMSGDTNLGQGSFGGASIRPSDGAALSPPHPVTGERKTTSTKGGISPMFKLAIPGERPTPDSRMTGPIMWYWNPSGGGGSGSWESLEYNSAAVHGNQPYPFGGDNAGWGYWGSNFMGFPLLRSDGAPFASLFNTIGDFDPKDSIPETIVFTQDRLDEPDFLPINIDGLSKQGFDYLRNKAIAGSGVNYDLYNYLHKRYGIGAANWYENNPTKPHGSNPNIPTPEAPYVPLASAPSPLAGAADGTEFAFFGGNNKKNTPPPAPTKKTRKGTMDATKASTGMYPSMTPEIFLQKYGINYNEYLQLPQIMREESNLKKYLEEGVKLGHFDPDVLNVDINDIRKGIIPEFPKDPPEMIGGYSAKSRLVRKDPELPPFIKVTRKDLAKNHLLTDKEIQDFLDDVKRINEYIKKNPAELIYAMTRYPKNDPRLAQLNYKMDEMKRASDDYVETHFPENKKLFNKLQAKIKNNIDQTDPKNFTGHTEAPKFTDDNLEMNEQKKKIMMKHFKKPVKIKKLFKR